MTIELANSCNLHCAYCLRDEDALYHDASRFMEIGTLRRVVREAREVAAVTEISFTGGEPTLHPNFAEAIAACAAEGMQVSFVTNGWNFQDIFGDLMRHRESLHHVAFSVDGTRAETHDRWRGQGSFERLIRAFSYCHKYEIPFVVKVGIRRDTVAQLEEFAMFAARFGAARLSFAHLMPTSPALESNLSLTLEEQRQAEEEIALLARIFKMAIGIDVGYYNIDEKAPCSPLAGSSYNIDYEGRLTLCCNLSGFRGSEGDRDVVADLNTESFGDALKKFEELSIRQSQARLTALSALKGEGITPDLQTGSPCLFCLKSFGKLPWQTETVEISRSARR
jgi:MoaA/NifB/PqqE/SkfB family radical SAM enzyme